MSQVIWFWIDFFCQFRWPVIMEIVRFFFFHFLPPLVSFFVGI